MPAFASAPATACAAATCGGVSATASTVENTPLWPQDASAVRAAAGSAPGSPAAGPPGTPAGHSASVGVACAGPPSAVATASRSTAAATAVRQAALSNG